MSMPVTEVTALLLTDVVGSTALWQAHAAQMNVAMARHHEIVAKVVAAHGGRLPQDQGEGDARFAAFSSAIAAVSAAVDIQRALATEPWPDPVRLTVRMGIHAGEVIDRDGNLFGDAVNRCARIRGLAHGGQVLLSGTTKDLVETWLPDGVGLLDLGEHRMKDLTAPVRIFQVTHPDLPADFPPLASLNRAKHNLPVQLSSYVGQEAAIRDLAALVRAHPLVTVTGFGGMGKTRLALQVAAKLADGEGDGVWFVDLSDLREADLVPETVAHVLGVTTGADRLDALGTHLADKQLLLVLDNVEQLLPAAAPIVASLAAAGPGVRVLATSREAAAVRGEQLFPVPPLPSPVGAGEPRDVAALGRFDAVRLFTERASAADPSFVLDDDTAPTVAAICAALDGWPLALELAGARLLGVGELLARLTNRLGVLTGGPRDAPDRQRTLRETIAWSYDLLPPAEQCLLRRLSVFAGGSGLAGVEAVCAPDLGADVLDALASLLDKGLLRNEPTPAGPRYRMLESVRDFAAEQLAGDSDAAAVRARHARFYAELFADLWSGPRVRSEVGPEVPNLVDAIELLALDDPGAACRLLFAVDLRLEDVGAFGTSVSLCEGLKQVPGLDPAARAALDVTSALHDYRVGSRGGVLVTLPEATERLIGEHAYQDLADKGAYFTACMLAEQGHDEQARYWAGQVLAVSEWAPTAAHTISARRAVAYVDRLGGRAADAVASLRQALAVLPADAGPAQAVVVMADLCRCLVAAGEVEEALSTGRRAVEIAGQTQGLRALIFAEACHSRALLAAGRTEEAADGFLRSLRYSREAGTDPYDLGWVAVAVFPVAPEAGAALLGAADALFAKNEDRDLYPPPELLDPVRAACEAEHVDDVLRGRQLGWQGVLGELDELDLG